MSAPTVTDRTSCTAARHGDALAYQVDNCRCADAREDNRIYRKQLRENRRPAAYVDNTGPQRRLRGLAVLGWPPRELAKRLGCTYTRLEHIRSGDRPRISREMASKIAQLYEDLSGTPGPSTKTRNWATRAGWVAPLRWEDDTIDNPNAQPIEDKPVRSSRVDLGEVEHLRGGGLSEDEIARRLGVKVESIDRAEARARERAAQRSPEAIASYWGAIAAGHTPAQAAAAAEEEELVARERDRVEDRDDSKGRMCA